MISLKRTPRAASPRSRRPRRATLPTALEMYFQEINKTALLNAREEKDLARRVAAGDVEARDCLVRANLRLVANLARRYANRGVDLADLIMEGNLGLFRAVEDFDPTRNCRFSTYATHWIRQAIGQGVMKSGPTVRLPAYMMGLLGHWRRATTKLREELGRTPTSEEVAERLKLPLPKVQDVARAFRIVHRAPQTAEGRDHALLERQIEDERTKLPHDSLIESEERNQLLDTVKHMEERESAVIRWRFGLEGAEELTLEEIGRRLGVTRERVRQIEVRALEKLRTRLLAG